MECMTKNAGVENAGTKDAQPAKKDLNTEQWWTVYEKQQAQLMLTNSRDVVRGQSRSQT